MLSSDNSDKQMTELINGYTAVDTTGESGKTDKNDKRNSALEKCIETIMKSVFMAIGATFVALVYCMILAPRDTSYPLVYDNTTLTWKIENKTDTKCARTDRSNICLEEAQYAYYIVTLVWKADPSNIMCKIPYRQRTMEQALTSIQTYSEMGHFSVRDGGCEEDRGRPILESPFFWLAYVFMAFVVALCANLNKCR